MLNSNNKDFEELSLTVVSLKIECTCNSERTYFTAIPAGKNYFTLLLPPSPPLAHFLTLCRLLSGLKCPNKPTIHHCAALPVAETDSYMKNVIAVILCAWSRLLYLTTTKLITWSKNEENAVVPSLSIRRRKSYMKARKGFLLILYELACNLII